MDYYDGLDGCAIAQNLACALRCKTVSLGERDSDFGEFEKLEGVLACAFPLVHSAFAKERICSHSLLFSHVCRSDDLPLLLLAHMDVVEAGEGWSVDPFVGLISGGYVYGRGALDMKCQLMAIFEALEALLKSGAVFTRSIYIALGHDEERSEVFGAPAIASELAKRGLRFECVMDECTTSFLTDDYLRFFGLPDGLFAAVGIAEKGYATLELSARSAGGHSSTPPKYTALANVAKGIVALCERPMPAMLCDPFDSMVKALLPYMDEQSGVLFGDIKGNEEELLRKMEADPRLIAMVRSTFAPTMAAGSTAHNVLPTLARACVNVRIAPFDSADGLLEHVRAAVGDVCQAHMRGVVLPVPPSNVGGVGYKALERSVRHTFDCPLTPTVMTAATDSASYRELCGDIFRFSPYPCAKEDGGRIHSCDERVSLESLVLGVSFFIDFIKELCL